MAMAYDPNVLRTILAVGNRLGAGPKAMKAAVEAGLVESGLQNLNHGDRDSLGVFQQRPSQGWGSPAQVRNVEYAATRFFNRAIPLSGKYGSAGQLAQAVQRSAFPERYDQRSGEAERLLSGAMRGGTSSGGVGGSSNVGGGGQPAPPEVGQVNLAALLAATSQKPAAAPASPLPDPAFSSRANLKLPDAYQSVQTTSPEPQGSGLDQALAILAASPPPTDLPATQGASAGVSGAQAGSQASLRGRMGDVRVASGANRPGVSLSPGILRVVREVAGVAGQPITIGTGTNHSQLTVNGNVSDHWGGNAADIPARGKTLVQLGQDALIAAGMDPKKARQQTGGLFNVPYGRHRRIQVIFNTHVGGDHTNHLHVGVTPVRR